MDDKRKSGRIKKSIKCEVYSDGLTFSSTIDISDGGMFISTPEPLNENSEVDLVLHLTGTDPIELKARVRWNRDERDEDIRAGMGVEFLNPTTKQTALINKYLEG